MKKFLAIIIAAALLASSLTACGGENGDNGTSTTPADVSDNADNTSENTESAEQTSDAAAEDTSDSGEDNGGSSASEGEAEKILAAIREAYGENYLPNMPVEKEYLVSVMGLEEGSFTDFAGELPMISAQADMAVIVKAAEGKAADVKSKLEAYRTELIENSFQYPMNLPKVNASKVLENGDYLGFIILGAYGDDENTDEAEQASFAEEQAQIGVDAFNGYFA